MKTLKILLSIILLSAVIHSQIPGTIAFQGVLTDSSGSSKPDGNYQIQFSFYDDSLAMNSIWNETQNIQVNDGFIYAQLGKTAVLNEVDFSRQYWLGIKVENENEMQPRIPLSTSPYSFMAARSDTAAYAYESPANTNWQLSGGDIYRLNGKVGIGTIPGEADLHIKSNKTAIRIDLDQQQDYERGLIISTPREWSKNLSFLKDDIEQSAFYGNGSAYFLGYLSIGSTLKWAKLNVTAEDTGIQLDLNHAENNKYGFITRTNNISTKALAVQNNDSDKVIIYGDGSAFIKGRVGIGTTVPTDYMLAVDGKIKTKEVLVTLENWPDYVFDDDYELRPITELERFINIHGHLPGVPSAETVEKDGAGLGEIQKNLLEKIEELTLYLIDQNERISKLENENIKLKEKLESIEK